ncbi:transposase [Marinomonas sp. E8]|uniref:Transposase n=1 Tax=Marinomonas algarum TaxID=2883105 RepID=A0A9X1LFI4_9GAMM|nr:transposase [Marinomonas algarum]
MEKECFKWPRKQEEATMTISHEQWNWLLRGVDMSRITPHESLYYTEVS